MDPSPVPSHLGSPLQSSPLLLQALPPPPAQRKNPTVPLHLPHTQEDSGAAASLWFPVNTARFSPSVHGQLLDLAISPTPGSHSAAARALGDPTQKPRQSLIRWGTARSRERAVQGCVGRYRPSIPAAARSLPLAHAHAWSSGSGLGTPSSLLCVSMSLMLGALPGKSWWVTELTPKQHWRSERKRGKPFPSIFPSG